MSDLDNLQLRLASVLEGATRRRALNRIEREEEMQDLTLRRTRFDQVASTWVSTLIVPRLRALAQAFPQAEDVKVLGKAHSARVEFGWTPEYPVTASLAISVVPDRGYQAASLHAEPRLIPMLVGHPHASCCEFQLDAEDPASLAQFLDEAVVVFAESYSGVRDPDSPYQRYSLVTDPVCGMTIHQSDTGETQEYEGARYYFCATACAEGFRLDPERYVGSSQRAIGGGG